MIYSVSRRLSTRRGNRPGVWQRHGSLRADGSGACATCKHQPIRHQRAPEAWLDRASRGAGAAAPTLWKYKELQFIIVLTRHTEITIRQPAN